MRGCARGRYRRPGGTIGPGALPLITATQETPTENSAVIAWDLSEPCTGYVEYGLTGAYGSQTATETNLFAHHAQTILGLASNTLYYYRIHSVDSDANEVTYADTFTTTGTVTTAVGPRATPSTPIGAWVYTVNVGDSTGTTDSRAALQSFIDAVPDGTTSQHNIVVFPSGSIYRFNDQGLNLAGRRWLDLWGFGCTIRNFGSGANPSQSAFRMNASHDMVVRGFTIRGGNAAYTRTYQQYSGTSGEQSEGFHVSNGSTDIEMADNWIYDQHGHAVYVVYQGLICSRIQFHHNHVEGMGTMGLVVAGGEDITYAWNRVKDTAISPIDIEDANTGEYIRNVYITDNEIDGWSWDTFYNNGCIAQMTNNAEGDRPFVHGIFIERNTILNGPIVGGTDWSNGALEEFVGPFTAPSSANGYGHCISVGHSVYGAGYIRDVVIRDNIIDDGPSGYGVAPVNNSYSRTGPYIYVAYAVNVTVTGNTCSGASGSVVQTYLCTGTVVTSPNP